MRRTHLSPEPDLSALRDARQKTEPDRKPRGIWYSFEHDWYEHVLGSMPEWISDYRATFEVEVDLSRILVLRTKRDLVAFADRYGHPSLVQQDLAEFAKRDGTAFEEPLDWIAWREVAKRWSGIEFRPYTPDFERIGDWYSSLDVASGCVWNTQAIRTFRRAPPGREIIHTV